MTETAQKTRPRGWVIIVAALLAVAVGTAIGFLVPITAPQSNLNHPAIGGPFELTDQQGRTVTDRTFAGKYMLVFFGYTYCPDVCPLTLQNVHQALDQLGSRADPVVPIFVTIDPERDTVDLLRDYAGHFHPRQVALTGSLEQTKAIARSYGVYFGRARDSGSTDYLMDHSSLVFLMGPDGRYVTHFRGGLNADEIARHLRRYL
ncbi:MAG: SCO family protein [Alphaproteobacteria bacterium]|nr:SCO family protein [Alphaproteobacteria bacterium]